MIMEDKDQLYKYANPVGRPRKYKPLELWEKACNYFEWCNNHPWTKYEAIKSGADAGKLVSIPVQIPYTLEGLAVFTGLDMSFFRLNRQSKDAEFYAVVNEIYNIIESQQFVGASSGFFNSSIIARKLGLVEKTAISTPEGEEIKVNATTEHRVIFENYDTDV